MEETTSVTRQFEWKLKNLNKASLKVLETKPIYSQEFKIIFQENEMIWKFRVSVKESFLEIFVYKVKVDSADMMEFEASIVDKNGKQVNKMPYEDRIALFENDQDRGCDKYISIDKLLDNSNNYIENDTLKLSLKLKIFKKSPEKLPDIELLPSAIVQTHLNRYYASYFNSTKLKDFTIICSDGVEIPAHRMVLASHSQVFEKMFQVPMTESRDNTVKINDIDSETMMEILRFMYLHKVENIDVLAPKLLYGADKYDIQELKSLCILAMTKNLSVDNVIEYYILADRYYDKDFLRKCLEVIKLSYDILRKSDDWKNLSPQLLQQLLDYFQTSNVPLLLVDTTL